MPRNLTLKQHGFIGEYLTNGGNGTRAALSVYDTDSPRVAEVIASENLSKPIIRAEIQKALMEEKLSVKDSLVVIKDALTATSTTKGGTKVEDWSARLRAADMNLKLHHAFDSEAENGPKTVHQHLHVEIRTIPDSVQRWLANWFREFKTRPSRTQFKEIWQREPSKAEAKLLAEETVP
jgi:phage terminase small subunit